MRALNQTLILISALMVSPAMADAASITDLGHDQGVQSALVVTPGARSLARMDLEPRAYLKRAYREPVVVTPETDEPVTTISRQMASDGPVGSVGLIALSGAEKQRAFGDSLAQERRLPTRALGLNVSYVFH